MMDSFLKIEGVEGESKDSKHPNEIQVESFSFGASQEGFSSHGTGAGAGKVRMQDFHFTTKISKASPKLMLACASGEHFKKATLVTRKAGKDPVDYMTYTMTDVMVTSYQVGGSNGSDVPMEQVSLNFTSIEYEYKEQKETGATGAKVKTGWDIKANKIK